MTIVRKKDFCFVFSTLILERELTLTEELNQELRTAILSKEREGQGMVRSNVGGWHSDLDFFKWPAPSVSALCERIQGAIKDYVAIEQQTDPHSFDLQALLNAWANVFRDGDYTRPHVHPTAHVSGVYYVDAGEADAAYPLSGDLEVLDPRNRPMMYATEAMPGLDRYSLKPKTGLLVLFPAWLYHYVHPYRGKRERISIAFNATLAKRVQRPVQTA